jgi:hypothetical protein
LLRWIFPAANRYCLLAFLPAADCPNIFFMPQNCFLTRNNFARKDKIRKMMSLSYVKQLRCYIYGTYNTDRGKPSKDKRRQYQYVYVYIHIEWGVIRYTRS